MLGFGPIAGTPIATFFGAAFGGSFGSATGASSGSGTGDFVGALIRSPHRYWRVYQYRNNGTQTGICELELAAYSGGPNLVAGGTASASGNYSGFPPSAAFDGDLGGNGWAVSGGGNSEHWLAYDFGSGNEQAIDEVRIAPLSDEPATPRIFEVQYSDTGVEGSWFPHFLGLFDETYAPSVLLSFTKPASGNAARRYAGITNTMSFGEKYAGQVAGSYLDLVCREFELAASPGGPSILEGGTPHWFPTQDPATALVDGNFTVDAYNGAPGCKRASIWYDFGAGTTSIQPREARYRQSNNFNNNDWRSLGEGYLIRSDDGRGWDYAVQYDGVYFPPPAPGETSTQFVEFAFVETLAAAGAAAGNSNAVAASSDGGRAAGTAASASSAAAQIVALGTIQSVGGGLGRGVATGVADPFRPAIGTSVGIGAGVGAGAAVGTISGTGSASGLGVATTLSAATGVISAVGAVSGVGVATSAGSGRLQSVGSASGLGLATAAASYVPTPAVGAAQGVGLANAFVSQLTAMIGFSAARSEGYGFAAGVIGVTGTALGQGSTTGVSNQAPAAVGSATGASSVQAIGTGLLPSIGEAFGVGAAAALGATSFPARGSATATSSAAAAAIGFAPMLGSAASTSTAAAQATSTSSSTGAAAAISTAAGTAADLRQAAGLSEATSEAVAVIFARTDSIGRCDGLSLATSNGVRVGFFSPSTRVIAVEKVSRVIEVPARSTLADRTLVVAPRDKIVVVPANARSVAA